jgi:hypothetical protein
VRLITPTVKGSERTLPTPCELGTNVAVKFEIPCRDGFQTQLIVEDPGKFLQLGITFPDWKNVTRPV